MKKMKIVLNTTNMCNLKCKYCYVDKSNHSILSYSVAQNIINNIREMSDLFERKCTFFGGEPSLAKDLIVKIIENNSDFEFSIISNGYQLFKRDSYDFYKMFSHITITIEGTEVAYRELRGASGLNNDINKLIELKRDFNSTIIANISLNGMLLNDVDEFINNISKLRNADIKVHLYSIKGENYFTSPEHVYDLLSRLESYDEDFLSRDFLKSHELNLVDTEFLCTYDDSVTFDVDGNIITCNWNKASIGTSFDKNTYTNILKLYRNNHKSLYEGCDTCDVPVGYCMISCPEFIKDCIERGELEKLNHCCSCERTIHFKRLEMKNKYGD